jgi:hypothetical protein
MAITLRGQELEVFIQLQRGGKGLRVSAVPARRASLTAGLGVLSTMM